MAAFLDGVTCSYPALPQEDISGKLFAPRERVLEYVSHYNLEKYYADAYHHAADEQIFFELVEHF
jgi:hypothetical protein